jgi:hypothetical protein
MRIKTITQIIIVMNFRNTIKYLSVAALFFTISCCDNGSGNNSSAVVNGRVEGDQNAKTVQKSTYGASTESVEAATVTAATVSADGTMTTISNVETETNAQGEFSLEISEDVSGDIVVMAEKSGTTWKGYVYSGVESGGETNMKPITTESTVETDIYAEMKADGEAESTSYSSIETYVDSEVATNVYGNTRAYADIATAISSQAETEAAFYSSSEANVSSGQMTQIAEARASAQAQLESDLYAASSSESRTAAYAKFNDAVLNAYSNAEVTMSTYVKAKGASAEAFAHSSMDVSSEAMAKMQTNASARTAIALESATEAQFQAMSASESNITAAANAAATLQSDLEANIQSESEIKAAFQTYHDTVLEIMKDESSEANATALTELDASVNANGGLKDTFESSLSIGVSVNLIINAYTEFITAIRTQAENNLDVASSAEMNAMVEAVTLINLSN